MTSRPRAAIVGATGYTGAELARLLIAHPYFELGPLVGHSKAGQPIEDVLPSLAGLVPGDVAPFDADTIADAAELAFCALPHGASAPTVAALRERGLPVFDLSADFRLTDADVYHEWYGEHGAPALFGSAVYGLVELHREALRTADLVAVPGCYPTASTLALAPLLASGLIETTGLVIDAKSGVSGAGRSPTASTHLPETAEGFRAYKVAGTHRHTPEIEQELGRVAGTSIRLTFTPHLVPMTRGILATGYAMAKGDVTVEQCRQAALALYEGSASVHVLSAGKSPDTLWVRGSNRAHVAYHVDRRTGRVLAQAAIDNLVKGAAGQAVQCANLRFGFEESAGLAVPATWP
ncbi:MAG: N-acetyl-gamma-glutamyl-phosphate reductase [Sandaracinus sp.]|nr:N-acetyl-gamma-glutamyl-phosphate reductase [Sandaracinus sp.]MCB9614705.1 N-acetyl-gamma-glutamyl-phosphate reductase [Sandaracinus sp.]MCB9632323.1 N-acetyl-gamma-glutamyl-phosphate reductase [Sandaracinus sp.]